MGQIVRDYKKNPEIRTLAGTLTRFLPNKAWSLEIGAVFDFVRNNIRYTEDITDIETIHTPDFTLAAGYGDCDDMAVLLASLLEAIGKPTRFVALAFKAPGEFEHVFTQAKIGNRWFSLDPTEPEPIGWQPLGFVDWMTHTN